MSTTYFFLLFIAIVVLATPSLAQNEITMLYEQDDVLHRYSILDSAPTTYSEIYNEELKHKHEHKHKHHRKLSPSPAEAPEEHQHKHKHKRSRPPAEAPKSDNFE
ncbi:hypothetical protein A4A49_38254 [Nicotiana attenuata]|uniref:Uncharacterized protein n=1 Tax=Nicotiana attenuata TaxID=49451 RepID=A0A1J6I2E2_NICAT|nr:hypothetical protein A4A49_38254 [Nicotiana attenuata]